MDFNREHSHESGSADQSLELSDTSLAPFTMRFRDTALEAAFQESNLHEVRRTMVGLAIAGLFGTILSGYGTFLHYGASSWVFTGALWVRLPLMLLAMAAIPTFLVLRDRTWLYSLHTLLLICGCLAIALRTTGPLETDATVLALFHVSRDGVLMLLIAAMYVLVLIPGWFGANVVIITLVLAGFVRLAWTDPTGPDNVLNLALISIAAFAFTLGIAMAVRRLWRHTYLAHVCLRRANEKLEHLAHTDELTECANRRYFFQRGNLELEKALRYHWPLSVIAIDIDHFKAVNDEYGHASGDQVLKAFGALLRRNLREVDLPARIGGEEFVLLLPGTDREQAAALAERLRDETERSFVATEVGEIGVKASFGVADITGTGNTDFDSLISAADTALYQAKKTGRNRVVEASNGGGLTG